MDRLATFITGEGNWLPVAMTIALASVGALHLRITPGRQPRRARVLSAMNLFVGVTLVVMGIGHVLAVTIKQSQGTLAGPAAILYPIGVAICLPAALIVAHTPTLLSGAVSTTTVWLHGWMAATLIALGLINTPLAIPGILTVAYARHGRPRTGTAIAGMFLLISAGLFAGGMMFLLSGARTFEEFSNR